MHHFARRFLLAATTLLIAGTPSFGAAAADDPEGGWENLGVLALEGYIDAPNTSIQPGTPRFSGCDFNRLLVFRGNSTLLCHTQQPYFGLATSATVLRQGPNFKIVVNGRTFDGLSR